MGQTTLFFSLLFFAAFAVYVFFGIYIFYKNPKSSLNITFFLVCISLCFWSLGFSLASSAPDLETCRLWRRVSALGWGSIYSLMLHFLLLLTGMNGFLKRRRLRFLLHLPAVVSLCVFSFSARLSTAQYHLVKMDYGWANVSVPGGWTTFFHAYYISYVLACLVIVWRWRRGSSDPLVRKQATAILISVAAALLLGSLTDVVLSSALAGPLPQMAPVFTLMPIAAIYLSMRRYSLMREPGEEKDELILSSKTRARLFFSLSAAYISGGLLCFLPYFLSHMINEQNSLSITLFVSQLLFFLGIFMLLVQVIKNEKIKQWLILAAMLFSIPTITLSFIDYASITVWVFPFILLIGSLVFSTRVPLVLITVVSMATQVLVWINAPQGAVKVDEFDYVMRIGIYAIALWLGSFVNRTYADRLKENSRQIEFQTLVSDISFDFVSVCRAGIDEKINAMLCKTGCFFQVDRAYVFLIDDQGDTFSYTHEWCNEGITPEMDGLQHVPLDIFPWWMEQLKRHKLVYIKDVSRLPAEASVEKEQLTGQGVKSAVVIPIEEDGEFLGFMGFDSVLSRKSWSGEHIQMLKILANLLANGLRKIKSEKEIEHMAYYDHLTGLPNRTLFSDRLTQAIHLAERNARLIGVIFLDLDCFKMVNDTMGHSAGDTLLKEVARGLSGCLRKSDTVARFGGDEFLMMINDLKDNESIIRIADTVMEMFTNPFKINGQEFFVTGSAGLALYPVDGKDAETLVKNADIAMYTAKTSGKNQYTLCTRHMKEKTRQNMLLSNHLYRVEERGELVVYYQPQIKLQTGRIVGLEALLRWNHPELGMILPGKFISLAEINGTINGIGEWVLKTAVGQNKKWHDMGFDGLRIAVNLSPVQLNNPRFADNLDRILYESGMDPRYLELEITESVATKESGHIADTLNRLKALGLSISIDDFGTEYSSLNRLKSLPIDRIKIDMQFIHGIEGNEKDQAITRVIINLAKTLGLEVLAEGVETGPQLEFLNQKMCDEVQGYYYYEPMPAQKIEEVLTGERSLSDI